MKNFFVTLRDLFYPPHCLGCQQALWEKNFLCSSCELQIEPLVKPYCEICSYSLANDEIKICNNCAERKLYFTAVATPFRYQGFIRELIARYKYGRDQTLRPLLQNLIVTALQDKRLQKIDFVAVVPVPLHPLRKRERGFDQVLPLARAVAQSSNLPLRFLLKRTSPTSFQAGSDRKKRLQNLKGAFALNRSLQLCGNYLLVDDVLTTGATLSESANILLQAGADQVWALTLAR